MQNPADTDPVRQAVSHHGILLGQHTLALKEVMDSLRELTTRVMEIRDQVNQPSSSETRSPGFLPRIDMRVILDYVVNFCYNAILCSVNSPSLTQRSSRELLGFSHRAAAQAQAALWEKQSPVTASYAAFTTEMRKVFDHPVRGQEASKRLLSLCQGQAVSEPDDSLLSSGSSGISMGGLKSVLKDAVSPAFGATIIIIITVVMSGSAYLCFLKYVCADCCKPMQVAPTVDVEPNKVEEQV
uniref:uncharacterized protein LOC122765317 n=1 Tax=Solea senegalensis TaxID=28829 RepID=UPI001CD90984|nr:uncharacterized protein LOC122765317 [Solea senegalensis]